MQYDVAIAKAAEIGAEHGKNAAGWYFDSECSTENYRATLEGIESGDPMTLDGFPSTSLSGEWAGCYSLEDLGEDTETGTFSDAFDDVVRAYEDAFYQACSDEIERVARYHLGSV